MSKEDTTEGKYILLYFFRIRFLEKFIIDRITFFFLILDENHFYLFTFILIFIYIWPLMAYNF